MGRSTIDHIFVIRQIIEKYCECPLAYFGNSKKFRVQKALENVIRKVPWIEDLTLKDGSIILVYADNIVIIEKPQEQVKMSMVEMMKVGKSIGPWINMEITKCMKMAKTLGILWDINISNIQIEQIKDFNILRWH